MEAKERTNEQEKKPRKAAACLNQEQLLALASLDWPSQPRDSVTGTLRDWPEWAQLQPQRQLRVVVSTGAKPLSDLSPLDDSHKSGDSSAPPTVVSLLSWNVLSRTWMRACANEMGYVPQPLRVEENCSEEEEASAWATRAQAIVSWIERIAPDVLTLQEVDFNDFEQYFRVPLDKLGYEGTIQVPKKLDVKKQPCAAASFWKRDRFSCVTTVSRSRSLIVGLRLRGDQEDSQADSKDASSVDPNHREEKKEAQPQQPGTAVGDPAETLEVYAADIALINVHLESNQKSCKARAKQFDSALRIARTQLPGACVLLGGDFNTGADSSLLDVVRRHEWHGFQLASAYEHPAAVTTHAARSATIAVPHARFMIDHILYDHTIATLRAILEPLSAAEWERDLGKPQQGLPSLYVPSDHMPVGALFHVHTDAVKKARARVMDFLRKAAQPPKAIQDIISPARAEAIQREWQAYEVARPVEAAARGAPSPEAIAARREHAKKVKEWIKSLDEGVEQAYAKTLMKQKGGKKTRTSTDNKSE